MTQTCNAVVQGFNANGFVNCKLASGVTVTVRQTGNGELVNGQPVVVQESKVPGVAGVCFDPSGQLEPRVWPQPKPEPADRECNVWILYLYEGKLWIGGHKKVPEKVKYPDGADVAVVNTGNVSARLWGGSQGWELSLYSSLIRNKVLLAGSKRKSKFVSFVTDFKLFDRGLLTMHEVYTPGPLVRSSLQWTRETTYSLELLSGTVGTGYRREEKRDPPNGQAGSGSYSLPYPCQSLVSSFSSLWDYGPPEINRSSGTQHSISFFDGTWAVCGKVVHNYLYIEPDNSPSSLTGGWTRSAIVTNGSTVIDLGVTDTASYIFAGAGNPDPVASGSFSNYSTLNYPVLTDMVLLTQPDPKQPSVTIEKYKHYGVQKQYKLKLYDMTRLAGIQLGVAVADVQVKAWGIPKDAVVLDVASYLPNATKYLTP